MRAESACALANAIIYRPGWKIEATCSDRFEDAICVHIHYPTQVADRDQAPDGYPTEVLADAKFTILAGECDSDIALYREVLLKCFCIDHHEGREFFRVGPNYWAPFHPHRMDGMKRWGDEQGDISFGVVA